MRPRTPGFTRPVSYQDVPESALPAALRADNPWGLSRRVNAVLETPDGGR